MRDAFEDETVGGFFCVVLFSDLGISIWNQLLFFLNVFNCLTFVTFSFSFFFGRKGMFFVDFGDCEENYEFVFLLDLCSCLSGGEYGVSS